MSNQLAKDIYENARKVERLAARYQVKGCLEGDPKAMAMSELGYRQFNKLAGLYRDVSGNNIWEGVHHEIVVLGDES